MNHPSKEVLASFIYDELPAQQKTEVVAHLEKCEVCRAQVKAWRGIQQDLTAWKLPAERKRSLPAVKVAKWAAAAAILLLVGFGLGRSQSPTVDVESLRAALERTLETRLNEEIAAARNADRQQFIAMLRDVEEQRISDYTQLRKDLETVAVVADQKLASTERALTELNLIAHTKAQ